MDEYEDVQKAVFRRQRNTFASPAVSLELSHDNDNGTLALAPRPSIDSSYNPRLTMRLLIADVETAFSAIQSATTTSVEIPVNSSVALTVDDSRKVGFLSWLDFHEFKIFTFFFFGLNLLSDTKNQVQVTLL